ncbi:RNA-directed DNA polymerase, eukaryota, partial [Tanacetum coccineum]
ASVEEGQHSQAMVRRVIQASEEETRKIEEVYRQEVGETENVFVHEDGSRFGLISRRILEGSILYCRVNQAIMQMMRGHRCSLGEVYEYELEALNRKRANLTVKGIMVDGVWVDEPSRVKKEFRDHFAARFQDPGICHGKLNFSFPNRLSSEQVAELEIPISKEEIRNAVWGCGENKSPGPDGFTFEFFRKYWHIVGTDFCLAVEWFFNHDSFSVGCNSSFIALIPKSLDPKLVSDFRPISLIGSVYKVITKILQNRLSFVISDLISDVQSAFLPNRQILDGPFILNDLLARCHFKKQSAMVFKVDFAKAYDSIRWDYLEDVLHSFGFGVKWRSWIKGCLSSSMASILVNGSPTSEFQFHRGLKQGDPLAPYLFILIMESLHLSFSRVIDAGIFTGVRIDASTMISHLFYADDVVFIGEWSQTILEMAGARDFGQICGLVIMFSAISFRSYGQRREWKLLNLRQLKIFLDRFSAFKFCKIDGFRDMIGYGALR